MLCVVLQILLKMRAKTLLGGMFRSQINVFFTGFSAGFQYLHNQSVP
jgi:hypothetical protein